jgi:hypothetical protein
VYNGASVLGFNKQAPEIVDDLRFSADAAEHYKSIHRLFCTIWITHAANSDLSTTLPDGDVPLVDEGTSVEQEAATSLSGLHCDHHQGSVSSSILSSLVSITLLW